MTDHYKVVSKVGYHMYALGEIITRRSAARHMDGFLYINDRGISQVLPEETVELVLDTENDPE